MQKKHWLIHQVVARMAFQDSVAVARQAAMRHELDKGRRGKCVMRVTWRKCPSSTRLLRTYFRKHSLMTSFCQRGEDPMPSILFISRTNSTPQTRGLKWEMNRRCCITTPNGSPMLSRPFLSLPLLPWYCRTFSSTLTPA